MLLALVAGTQRGVRYNSRVNLLTASPWVVPGGVTQLSLNAAALGGAAGNDLETTNHGGGGGGGGWIRGALATVVPGETLTVTTTGGNLGSRAGIEVTGSTSGTVCYVQEGQSAQAAVTGNILGGGGLGGNAFVAGGAVQDGGNPGASSGASGSAGNASTSNGIVAGGGGGGNGGTISPTGVGGTGGSSSGYAGGSTGLRWGNGGGGMNLGSTQLTSSTVSSAGVAYAFADYTA